MTAPLIRTTSDRLLAILDVEALDAAGRNPLDATATLVDAGVRRILLRARGRAAAEQLRTAAGVAAVARAMGARVLLSDRVDVAVTVGVDGVHLPSTGLGSSAARRLLPHGWIGVTAHDEAELARVTCEADYVLVSPVFVTRSKPMQGPPLQLHGLARLVSQSRAPVFALGGVTAGDVADIAMTGAAGVAVMGDLCGPEAGRHAAALLEAVSRAPWHRYPMLRERPC